MIMGKPYAIPAFARHLNAFTTQARGSVLQKRGEQNRYFYRFVNPLLQPFIILMGLANDHVDEERIEKLENRAGTIDESPTVPEQLF